MATPDTTTTPTATSSSSSGAQAVIVDSPGQSLTTQPREVLVQITDCLPLSEQLRLGRQVGSRHLFDFITHLLPTKRSLKLEINYAPQAPAFETPNPLNAALRRQLDLWRAAVRRIVKQQQPPPEPERNPLNSNLHKSKQQNPKHSSSSAAFTAFPLFEEVDDRFLGRVAMEEKRKKKKMIVAQQEDCCSSLPKGSSTDEAALSSSPVVGNEDKVEAKDDEKDEDKGDEDEDEDEDEELQYAEPDEAELAFESAHGYVPSAAAAFRRHFGLQPRLLSSVTSFEVSYLSHDTDCLKVAAAALAALLHSSPRREGDEDEEEDHQPRPIQLRSFAFYTLSFGSEVFLLSFLARLYKILSTTSLKSLTLFGRRPFLVDTFGDAESDWRQGPLYSDPIPRLPVFPAVEELVLGGIDGSGGGGGGGGELAFLLGGSSSSSPPPPPVFPALQRLVLVLHHLTKETVVTVEAVAATLQAISAPVRRQLTALSVYSFEGLLALHKRQSRREAKEAVKEAKMAKGDDQEEEEEEEETGKVVNLAHDELVAYVREHFPAVVRFNGQPI
ncbi:hypothetical protein TYRP_008979 [Tyrophagus putrescentiae]|nr:hypothetical protein TYRP_008979 [Tyrophagus putrescentiae]